MKKNKSKNKTTIVIDTETSVDCFSFGIMIPQVRTFIYKGKTLIRESVFTSKIK